MSIPTTTCSLILTVFNRDRYLAQAIDSVLAQTYQNWELIIWDDGSTDSSVEIALNYAENDRRISVYPSNHQGRVRSLVKAIDQSKGKYLATIDSDDRLTSTALEETVNFLEKNPNTGMVYTKYLRINEQGSILGEGHRCRIPYSPHRLLIDFMTFHFRLIRREIYDRVGGFDPFFESVEDYDLCLKISEITEVCHLNLPLYYYREHGNQISRTENIKQIYFSQIAINNALKRRGLDKTSHLRIQCHPTFYLVPKDKE